MARAVLTQALETSDSAATAAREDTSQDYHIEGLPFGTRGGMLVPHTFPSDGEYTVTITPIFGDNMSPTGFGSVPCERLSVVLDSNELALINWQGGGRNTPNTNCGRGGANVPRRARQHAAREKNNNDRSDENGFHEH